jgi:hypothetical protein
MIFRNGGYDGRNKNNITDDKNVGCTITRSGVVMVSVYSLWKADNHSR